MAKNDNLVHYLTDIADAIREKNGTTDPINAQDFAELISVKEDKDVVANDVNFYDYDGTLLYSYTWDEACKLTKLPEAPSHEGLVFQEWNYSLEDIWDQGTKSQVYYMDDSCLYEMYDSITFDGVIYNRFKTRPYTEYDYYVICPSSTSIKESTEFYYFYDYDGDRYIDIDEDGNPYITCVTRILPRINGYADIGANYITNDGSTKIYINVVSTEQVYNVGATEGCTIDWGDGVKQSESAYWHNHTYLNTGFYTITVIPTSETLIGITTRNIDDDRSTSSAFIEKIEIGENILGFTNESSAPKYISIPNTVTSIDFYGSMLSPDSLKCVIVPKGAFVNNIPFNYNQSIISIPNNDVEYTNGFNFGELVIDRLVFPAKTKVCVSNYGYLGGSLNKLIINSKLCDIHLFGYVNEIIINQLEIDVCSTDAVVNKVTLPIYPTTIYGDLCCSILDLSMCVEMPCLSNNNFDVNWILIPGNLYRDAEYYTNWVDWVYQMYPVQDFMINFKIGNRSRVFRCLPGTTWSEIVETMFRFGWNNYMLALEDNKIVLYYDGVKQGEVYIPNNNLSSEIIPGWYKLTIN